MISLLCGDVMTGRGLDQILPQPNDPRLWEPQVRDARTYVRLAEAAHGPIPQPVDPSWPWGDALPTLDRVRPDLRIINLETSVTARGTPARGKDIHYRMHPANIGCLTVARPDVCTLANNHLLDFGAEGLLDTLTALYGAGIRTAGAGPAGQAGQPVVVPLPGDHRAVVLAAGEASSGIPRHWAATEHQPGVHLLPDLSAGTATALAERLRLAKRAGDIAVFSVHWGSNWGYQVPAEQVRFAHLLIDHGVDVVHGHSSHHPRPIEIYRDRLILYGCGDFIDDYEGIGGHEEYRDDLRLMYLAATDPRTGRLTRLSMVPLQAHRMRLRHTSPDDLRYLADLLTQISRDHHIRVEFAGDNTLTAVPIG